MVEEIGEGLCFWRCHKRSCISDLWRRHNTFPLMAWNVTDSSISYGRIGSIPWAEVWVGTTNIVCSNTSSLLLCVCVCHAGRGIGVEMETIVRGGQKASGWRMCVDGGWDQDYDLPVPMLPLMAQPQVNLKGSFPTFFAACLWPSSRHSWFSDALNVGGQSTFIPLLTYLFL